MSSTFLSRLGGVGNAQDYVTDLRAKQQADQLANALNALKLQQGQTDMAGSGIAGNALLDALSGGGDVGGAQPMQAAAQPSMQQVPMPGAVPLPQQKPVLPPPSGAAPAMQQLGNASLGPNVPGIPPVNASSLQPPGGGMPVTGMPQQPQQRPMGGQPQMPQQQPGSQGLSWKSIATAIKKQNPNAKGPEVMAAIDRLTPMMSAQNKMEWENFKLQMQTQVKEQGMQTQTDIANRRADTAERGQDVRAASERAALEQRASAAEARVKELEANRAERGREANQKNETALKSIDARLSTAKKSSDPAYKALQDEYKTTAAAQRSMMNNPGMYTDQQKSEMEQKVQALQARVDAYTKTAAPSASGAAPVGEKVTVTKDGQDFYLPAEQLDDALKQGYTRKQ